MNVIHFTDGKGLAEGLRVFQKYGDAIPDDEPDTYIVSERVVHVLEQQHIHFERRETTKILPEDLFTNIQKSYRELQAGKLTRLEDPTCLDDIINTASDK